MKVTAISFSVGMSSMTPTVRAVIRLTVRKRLKNDNGICSVLFVRLRYYGSSCPMVYCRYGLFKPNPYMSDVLDAMGDIRHEYGNLKSILGVIGIILLYLLFDYCSCKYTEIMNNERMTQKVSDTWDFTFKEDSTGNICIYENIKIK